jgi:hypothetical protein
MFGSYPGEGNEALGEDRIHPILTFPFISFTFDSKSIEGLLGCDRMP